jgi:hypothetical protein
MLKESAQAIDMYRRCLAMAPQDLSCLRLLVPELALNGQLPEARDALQRFLSLKEVGIRTVAQEAALGASNSDNPVYRAWLRRIEDAGRELDPCARFVSVHPVGCNYLRRCRQLFSVGPAQHLLQRLLERPQYDARPEGLLEPLRLCRQLPPLGQLLGIPVGDNIRQYGIVLGEREIPRGEREADALLLIPALRGEASRRSDGHRARGVVDDHQGPGTG